MQLPKAYNPAEYESDIYALWEKKGAFLAKNRGSDDYFSIVMPPPNANANLHIGFGLTIAIEDTIVRYQRLKGKATLFVPGADHAGFETWVVYEKQLQKQGKSRFDFSREELYKQVWDFVETNKHNFQAQIRALGASCDWTRFTYTLDKKVVEQAYRTFKQMWDDGLIYRGKRIVNYCTYHGTSFSDVEVVHEEETTQLWNIAYPLADGSGEVVIATTRPETKLGQSALMINPKDKRYKDLIGKEVLQPLVPDKPIKIIADDYVDMDFGTGVVTVTPGHDPNDFEVAQRHHLPIIELITTEGKMSDNVPEKYRGLTVLEAREAVAEELAKKNMLRGVDSYTHSVGKCYKCGTVIEPLALEQWFVKMQPLAQPAIELLKKKEISFYPDSKRTQLIRYLEQLRDWNISRQIAWGIPIPAFQNTDDPHDWIFDERVDEETIEVDGKKYRRDPDVFDTWFSSSSWPYVCLNYPDGEEFKYYPTSLMETAGEILHQWVARMIMLGLYTTGKIPFEDVYIHGLVLAEGGAKMSKSIGNVVDAMEIVGSHGSDALRMGLLAGRAPAVNRGYDRRRVEEARNFCNKLWNVARFIEGKVGDNHNLRINARPESIADHWILNMLSISARQMADFLDSYRLSEAYETLYHFVWDDLADWYVEASKAGSNAGFLAYVLENTLKLAHPFAPFVTETIWQTLAWEKDNLLAVQLWPEVSTGDMEKAIRFERAKSVVTEIRKIGSVIGSTDLKLYLGKASELDDESELIKNLAGLSEVKSDGSGRSDGLRLRAGEGLWLALETEDVKKYLMNLQRQKMALNGQIERLESRLANKAYVEKAPPELVEQTQAELELTKRELQAVSQDLSGYEKS